jgi:hypothetical protein
MSQQEFAKAVAEIAQSVGDAPLDAALEARLNADYPPGSPAFDRLAALCAQGEAEGWLMAREAGGIRFGRAIKPGEGAGRFSVDVVRMRDVKGPHHVHTTGEIGAIFPLEGAPKFDGRGRGWYVYGPGSDHHPTVEGGDAHILYLLPEGAIEFTGR